MSLVTNLKNFATRVSSELKAHRVLINGNQADLSGLTTTNKSNLVSALNEVKSAVDQAAETGGATNLDQLTDVVIANPTTGQYIYFDGTSWKNGALPDSDVQEATETEYGIVRFASGPEIGTATPDSLLAASAYALRAFSDAFTSTLNEKADLNAVDGKANSADLAAVAFSGSFADMLGQLGTDQLPPLAINDVFPVDSQQEMLELTAERGDIAARTDSGRLFYLVDDDPTVLGNWMELVARGDVFSVAGRTGAVILSKSDVGLDQANNTSDANKPVSTAVQTALNGKQDKDATLTSLAGLATSANQMIYSTGPDAFSMAPLTAFARTLLDDADAGTARDTLAVYSTTDIGDPATDFVAVFNAGLV